MTGTPATYQYYGLRQPCFEEAAKHVFAKYNIIAERVGLSLIDDNLRAGVKAHNDSLFNILRPEYPELTEEMILKKLN